MAGKTIERVGGVERWVWTGPAPVWGAVVSVSLLLHCQGELQRGNGPAFLTSAPCPLLAGLPASCRNPSQKSTLSSLFGTHFL